MNLAERYDLESLRNKSADLVYHRVERFLDDQPDFCRCNECVLDLVAYILNHVTPTYGTSLLPSLSPDPGRMRRIEIQIDLALRAGARRIRLNPAHGA